MQDFTVEVIYAIKSNLIGLPSFCRLLIYELLPLCDYKTGVITVSTLDELARNDFQVASSPGRKKEIINGDTLRNALRTIKKFKPEQFKFSTKNQRIIIEMPFLRELSEKFNNLSMQVAAVNPREVTSSTAVTNIDEAADLNTVFTGEDVADVAAATSAYINNKTNKINKLTNISAVFCSSKKAIATDFYPNQDTIDEALSLGLSKVVDPEEIQQFIAYNQQQQTQWEDFNPIYLRWLQCSRRQQVITRKPIVRRTRDVCRTHEKTYAGKDYMAIVREQNHDAISPSGERLFASEGDVFNEESHGVVMGAVGGNIWPIMGKQTWCAR